MTCLRGFELLVLGAMLGGTGLVSSLGMPEGSVRAPDAPAKAHAGDRPLWLEVSQADTPVSKERGETIYRGSCSACHGATRMGVPSVFPSLIDVGKRQSDAEIASLIRHGKGKMPAFPDMSDEDIQSLLLFLKTPPQPDPAKISNAETARGRQLSGS